MNKQSKSQWLSGFLEMTHGRPMCFLGVWPLTGNKAGSQKGDQTITKLMVSFPQGWCRIRDFTEMVLIQSVCWCIDDSIYIYTYIYIHIYIYTYIYLHKYIYIQYIHRRPGSQSFRRSLWLEFNEACETVCTYNCVHRQYSPICYVYRTYIIYIYILPYITYRSILIHSIYIHIYTYMYI